MSLLFQEQFNQPINLSGSFTGSFSGSITSASFASTASYWSGSVLNTTSASFASTASYLNGSYVSSSTYNLFTSSYYIDSASFNYRIDNIVVDTGSYNIPPVVVNVATTAILPRSPLYNNGPSNDGINSYLSASISGTLGSIDGVSLTTGDNILVKNQTNQIQNGVYNVISTGSLSTFYILSRSLSSDETSELDSQIVIPSFGTTNRGGIFAQTTNNPIIGTDNIVYSLQTNTLISQTSAGTQAIYQIPWYIASTRQLSKGSPNLKYINVTSGNTVTTSSLILTGSLTISGSEIITGSLQITNGITGSLLGTASFTSTASFASTASYLNGGVTSASFASTASYWSGSVLNTTSASFASTASYWSGSVLNTTSASFASTASYWSGSVLNTTSASFASTASYWSGSIANATSASFASTASYIASSGGSTTLNSILAATATNSIDNGAFTQTWNWNNLSISGSGLIISGSGSYITPPAGTQKLLNVSLIGEAVVGNTTYAGYFSNLKTGVGSNWGLFATAARPNKCIGTDGDFVSTNNGKFTIESGAVNLIRIYYSQGLILEASAAVPIFAYSGAAGGFIVRGSTSLNVSHGLGEISSTRSNIIFGGNMINTLNYGNAGTSLAIIERNANRLIFSANSGLTAGANGVVPNEIMCISGSTTEALSSVGIGTTSPALSAKFEISSSLKGFLPPRMSTTERNNISSPATGLTLYNTTKKVEDYYNGTNWLSKSATAGSFSQVGSATTTFTVTIGTVQDNSTYKVNITPTSALSAALLYVTNKTTSSFDVVYLVGLTGTVTFDWAIFS
jgi:hypothetical protein